MITTGAAAENAVPAVIDVAVASGAPALEEPVWPWVSRGSSGDRRGAVVLAQGACFMPQTCPPPLRKTPRFGRWCSASTSCRMSARRASANWRSECGRGAALWAQGSVPIPIRVRVCQWRECPKAELGPREPALLEVERSLQRGQFLAFTLKDRENSPGFLSAEAGLFRALLARVRKRLNSRSSSLWGSGTPPAGPSGGWC